LVKSREEKPVFLRKPTFYRRNWGPSPKPNRLRLLKIVKKPTFSEKWREKSDQISQEIPYPPTKLWNFMRFCDFEKFFLKIILFWLRFDQKTKTGGPKNRILCIGQGKNKVSIVKPQHLTPQIEGGVKTDRFWGSKSTQKRQKNDPQIQSFFRPQKNDKFRLKFPPKFITYIYWNYDQYLWLKYEDAEFSEFFRLYITYNLEYDPVSTLESRIWGGFTETIKLTPKSRKLTNFPLFIDFLSIFRGGPNSTSFSLVFLGGVRGLEAVFYAKA
jgi:hypothetical protein